jgi:hypothetical protein
VKGRDGVKPGDEVRIEVGFQGGEGLRMRDGVRNAVAGKSSEGSKPGEEWRGSDARSGAVASMLRDAFRDEDPVSRGDPVKSTVALKRGVGDADGYGAGLWLAGTVVGG